MLKRDLPFPGMLTAIKTGTRKLPDLDEVEPFERIEIKHIAEGEVQTFLKSFQSVVRCENIQEHFEYPLTFGNIEFPEVSGYNRSNYTLTIDDALTFDVKLLNIKAKRVYKLGQDTVTYTLILEKLDANPEITGTLHAHYLNQKTRNPRNKIVPREFPIKMVLCENDDVEGSQQLM